MNKSIRPGDTVRLHINDAKRSLYIGRKCKVLAVDIGGITIESPSGFCAYVDATCLELVEKSPEIYCEH